MISFDSLVACCRVLSAACLLSTLFSTSLFAEDAASSPTAEALPLITPFNFDPADPGEYRSEERRVGKECA